MVKTWLITIIRTSTWQNKTVWWNSHETIVKEMLWAQGMRSQETEDVWRRHICSCTDTSRRIKPGPHDTLLRVVVCPSQNNTPLDTDINVCAWFCCFYLLAEHAGCRSIQVSILSKMLRQTQVSNEVNYYPDLFLCHFIFRLFRKQMMRWKNSDKDTGNNWSMGCLGSCATVKWLWIMKCQPQICLPAEDVYKSRVIIKHVIQMSFYYWLFDVQTTFVITVALSNKEVFDNAEVD